MLTSSRCSSRYLKPSRIWSRDGFAFRRLATLIVAVISAGWSSVTLAQQEVQDASTNLEMQSTEFKLHNGSDKDLERLKGRDYLTHLELHGAITDEGLRKLQDLPNLQSLVIQSRQITDAGLKHLAVLTKLKSLAIVAGNITDDGLQHLEKLVDLESLSLRSTGARGYYRMVTGVGLASVCKLHKLKTLDLSGCRSIRDAGFANLKELKGITSLTISSFRMTDAGLKHLQELTALTTLDIKASGVTDEGLKHLSSLTSLRSLALRGANVTGAGLAHLSGLMSLESIMLSECRGLTDDGLASLQSLDLVSLRIWSSVEARSLRHLKNMTKLQTLRFSLHGSREPVAIYLGHLTDLRSFDFPITSDAEMDEIKDLQNLVSLEVVGPSFTDAGALHLRRLENLESLSFSRVGITDKGLESLRALRKLESLSLSRTQITGAGLKYLAAAERLFTLNISGDNFTDDGLEPLSALTQLQHLSMGVNGVTNNGLRHIRGMKDLTWLRLYSCPQISDSGFAYIGELPSLQRLDFSPGSDCKHPIGDRAVRYLKDLDELTHLRLANTAISDDGLDHLEGLVNLSDLQIESKKLTDAGIPRYLKLKNLTRLELRNVWVTDVGEERLRALPKLHSLSVSRDHRAPAWLLQGRTLRGYRLTDTDLQQLKDRRDFTVLALNGSFTDQGLEHLKNLSFVTDLELESDKFGDAGLRHLRGMTKLASLRLRAHGITGEGLSNLRDLETLQSLTFSHCRGLSDEGLAGLQGLKIRELDFDFCEIAAESLRHLKQLPNLKTLHTSRSRNLPRPRLISAKHIGELTNLARFAYLIGSDAELAQLNGMKNLVELELSGPEISDDGLKHLKGMAKLESLTLDCENVSDAGLKHLAELPRLHKLDIVKDSNIDGAELSELKKLDSLTFNGVTNEQLILIGKLEHLASLSVSSARITDDGLQHFSGLTNLKKLDLGGSSQVTDAGLQHLVDLSELEYLGLKGLQITDTGLRQIKQFGRLQELDVSACRYITKAGIKDMIGQIRIKINGSGAQDESGG